MFAMLNAEPVGYQSVDVIRCLEKCTQLVEENPSLSNMGEGFINWGYTVVEKDSTFFYALLYVVL